MAATYVNAARPGRLAAKEDATSSSDTWNSWESCTYAGVTMAHKASATLVVKTLSVRTENRAGEQSVGEMTGRSTLTASKSRPLSSTSASSSYRHCQGLVTDRSSSRMDRHTDRKGHLKAVG